MACLINQKPLRSFLLQISPPQHSKSSNKLWGVMKLISSHPKIPNHIMNMKWQWMKRREDDSTPGYKTHNSKIQLGGRTPLLARFSFVGIRSSKSCQENATTFRGAGLLQTNLNTISFVLLNPSAGTKISVSHLYAELTAKTPFSSAFHHHLSSNPDLLQPILTTPWDQQAKLFPKQRDFSTKPKTKIHCLW